MFDNGANYLTKQNLALFRDRIIGDTVKTVQLLLKESHQKSFPNFNKGFVSIFQPICSIQGCLTVLLDIAVSHGPLGLSEYLIWIRKRFQYKVQVCLMSKYRNVYRVVQKSGPIGNLLQTFFLIIQFTNIINYYIIIYSLQ